jgi:hypothetical protein
VRGVSTAQSSYGVYGTANQAGGVGVFGEGYNVGVSGMSTTGFAMRADGNAYQQRDKGGWAKAMVHTDTNGGTIDRCYNALTGSSSGNCGFTVTNLQAGLYEVDFGFQVSDRFIVVTSEWSLAHTAADIDRFPSSANRVRIAIHYNDNVSGLGIEPGQPTNAPFFVIVF